MAKIKKISTLFKVNPLKPLEFDHRSVPTAVLVNTVYRFKKRRWQSSGSVSHQANGSQANGSLALLPQLPVWIKESTKLKIAAQTQTTLSLIVVNRRQLKNVDVLITHLVSDKIR